MPETDFGKIVGYSQFVSHDPFRNYLHYPAVSKELGNVKGKTILDVGCGDGLFSRILASQGARVMGYDKSSEKITEAENLGSEYVTQIEYQVASPKTFKSSLVFDSAASVMVLPYAASIDELKEFFTSTHTSLKSGGVFASLVFNPYFKNFNEVIGTRLFKKLDENEVEVNFLEPDTKRIMFKSLLHQYIKEDYESAAREAGFTNLTWSTLRPTEEGMAELGGNFWKRVIEAQPYSLFSVRN